MSKIEIETKDINVSSLILDENVNETEQMKESDVETNVVDFERDTDGNIKYHNRTHNRKHKELRKGTFQISIEKVDNGEKVYECVNNTINYSE